MKIKLIKKSVGGQQVAFSVNPNVMKVMFHSFDESEMVTSREKNLQEHCAKTRSHEHFR